MVNGVENSRQVKRCQSCNFTLGFMYFSSAHSIEWCFLWADCNGLDRWPFLIWTWYRLTTTFSNIFEINLKLDTGVLCLSSFLERDVFEVVEFFGILSEYTTSFHWNVDSASDGSY